MSQKITLEEFRKLLESDVVAIRGRAVLEPAGGPGDKVFPPSHSVEKDEKRVGAKYAFEMRRRDGNDVTCVLLDSVQSQANRMEEALQALWTEKKLTLPVIEVDLSTAAPDVGRIPRRQRRGHIEATARRAAQRVERQDSASTETRPH